MSLSAGARLGPYEIAAAIGAGGMGVVYRARDTRLERDVAIKILSPEIAASPDLRERFEREARTVASLNHPHICTLHDIGRQDDIDFLVMEYLDGETVEQRLKRGALPLDAALHVGIQVADAVAAAHRVGIVHRDLKPGNIMLTKSGAKLLDFGLAKQGAPVVAGSMSMLPTTPPGLTEQGSILGTFQYMAPEQLEGREADARSDIFAFGGVLYEMVTGRRALEGKSHASLVAAILEREPASMSTIQPLTPPALDRLVATCLAKDPDDRWQSARDLMRELTWIAEAPPSAAVPAASAIAVATPLWRRALPWGTAGALGLALLTVFTLSSPWATVPPVAPVRLEATIGADASIVNFQASLAVSPDGSLLAVAAQNSQGIQQLYVRRLSDLRATPLAGTAGARDPFFSPDGQWIGFFAGGKLKKIAVSGGAPVTLADAPDDRGGTWAEDGSIVFQPAGTGSGLMRVSSAGGTPVPLTRLGAGEAVHRWPQVLPGGAAILYTAHSSVTGFDDATIAVQPLPSGEPKVVHRGGYYGRYLPSGHLVYVQQGTLFAASFDPVRVDVTGQPVPVIEDIAAYPGGSAGGLAGSAQVGWTNSGEAVYLVGQSVVSEAPLQWMDRAGKVTALRAAPASWTSPRFSPDGRRLAVDIFSGQADIFVYEWARDTLTRVTFDPSVEIKPVWTPDGQRIVFRSNTNNRINLYWQRADGSGEVQRLTESQNVQTPASWHPDGKFLAFYETAPQTSNDLMILPMEGNEASGWKPGKPAVFLSTPFSELEPTFSPDGRWIAYQSNESGRFEVYVRPFPGPGGKWQISTDGGVLPTWSRTRPEIFYASPDNRLMLAPYKVEGDVFRADKPGAWSDRRFMVRPGLGSFDLHPDGNRFVLVAAPENESAVRQDKLVFIFNFFDELRRLAPTN